MYCSRGQPRLSYAISTRPMETLPILFQDDNLLAVNKPSALLVHRSDIDRNETRFALQIVRDQIGQHVFPLHRLDKPTSGVLLFALNSDTARLMGEKFSQHQIDKSYLCITRGFTPESGHIDHPLTEELDRYSDSQARTDKPAQAAQTDFIRLATAEVDAAIERYPTSRFSLVQCHPKTGRKHQLRRHLKHISHPIIGDAKHGKGLYNRYFRDHFNAGRLLLHCTRMAFHHPISGQPLTIDAPIDAIFRDLCQRFGWQTAIPANWCYHNDLSPAAPVCDYGDPLQTPDN